MFSIAALSLVAEAANMRHRAESLRQQASGLDDVLAMSYRRRASELELEAFLTGLQAEDGAAVTGALSA